MQGSTSAINSNHRKSNFRLWLLIAAGFLGLCAYCLRESEVFPFASIELKIPKSAIIDLSRQWCNRLGYDSRNAITSTIFDYDDNTKTFLEYELGLDKANQLMRSTIPTWYWSSHFRRPLKLEEMSVSISPNGELISLQRDVENDRAMPSLSEQAAMQLSTTFITKLAKFSLDGYKCIENGTIPQSHRTDHYFTFEDTRNEYHGAKLRVYAGVSGNKITEYKRFLFVPELWSRKFEKLRSYNNSLGAIASIFYVVITTAAFFTFLWAFANGLLRWRFALCIAAMVTLIEVLEFFNSTPALLYNYVTTMSFRGYVFEICMAECIEALQQFLQIFIVVGAAEALYRRAYPEKLALEKIMTSAGLAARQTVTGLAAGFGMFGLHLGWIILYYLCGKPLGFWSPLEVRNLEGLSNFLPYFSALYTGVTAAITEEFMYRVLGLSLLQKLVKQFWLANLLQALAWAFMHSNYPQEPPYARGLELTMVGLLYGFILRRYGVIACLVSHYLFDAFLSVSPLWSSPLITMKLGSVAALAPPAIILGLAICLQRYTGAKASSIANSEIPVQQPPVRATNLLAAQRYEYKPLSKYKRISLAAVAMIAAAIQFGYYFPTVGDNAQLNVSREQAISVARNYLTQCHIITGDRIAVASLSGDLEYEDMQYLFEKKGLARTRQLAMLPGRPLVWYVRFVRQLDETEYWVTLDSTGHPISLGIIRPEDAPGARPAKEWSIDAATRYLLNEHKELIPFHQDSYSSVERKTRTDATIVYDLPQFRVGEALCKVAVNTIGNAVCNYKQYWTLPESWKFERSKMTARQHVFSFVKMAIEGILLLAGLWWIILLARLGHLSWKPAIFLAITIGLLRIPQILNTLPELFVSYDTQHPLVSFFIQQGTHQIVSIFSSMAIGVALLIFSMASFRLLCPSSSITSIFATGLIGANARENQSRLDFWLDAILVGYAAGLGLRMITICLASLHTIASPTVSISALDGFCELANVHSCSLDVIIDGLLRGVQVLLMTGLAAGFCFKYLKTFNRYALVIVIVSLLAPGTERYWQDYLLWAADYLCIGLLAWPVVVYFARQNFIAYFIIGAVNIISASIRLLFIHGRSFYTTDIITLSLVLLSPLIYLLILLYRNRNDAASRNVREQSD